MRVAHGRRSVALVSSARRPAHLESPAVAGDDDATVAALLAGDEATFAALVRRYHGGWCGSR